MGKRQEVAVPAACLSDIEPGLPLQASWYREQADMGVETRQNIIEARRGRNYNIAAQDRVTVLGYDIYCPPMECRSQPKTMFSVARTWLQTGRVLIFQLDEGTQGADSI